MNLKIIIILLLLFQFSGCGTVSTDKEIVVDKNTTLTRIDANETDEFVESVEVNKTIDLDNFISYDNCDQIIEKEFSTGSLLSICYDYGYKSAKYVAYTLDGTLVNSKNINERPSYHVEREIPNEYRTTFTYSQTGYEHGHLAPDASFDYNMEDLRIVYTLANIIPQDPNINGDFWSDVEKYAREMAEHLGELSVINGVVFDKKPLYIGKNKMAVSKGFWKILYNEDEAFRECYYYDNFVLFDVDKDTLLSHKVDCNSLIIGDDS